MAGAARRVRVNVEVFADGDYAPLVAIRIVESLPARGAVIITGGTTAAKVYEAFDDVRPWRGLEVVFSDERCVPPDHAESNFRMANELFLARSDARVHRMEGESDPVDAARRYHDAIAEAIASRPALGFLGLGEDCHVGALFPYSRALEDPNYCAAVQRPDGLGGLTLTPSAMLTARSVRVLAAGQKKAEAVRRVVESDEEPRTCPARVLMPHADVTLYIDEGAASLL